MMYNNGQGVGRDPKEAFEWFVKAAKGGDPLGAFKVGCYLSGQMWATTAEDKQEGLAQKRVAAEAGYALAQLDVGSAYYEQGDEGEAAKWWMMAAEQGEPMGLYNLSVVYAKSDADSPDRQKAYAYFKLAKLATEGQINPRANETLETLCVGMSADARTHAEDLVSRWKPHPTPLTLRAMKGIDDARRLATNVRPRSSS
jgi:hypothetical protein